MNSFRFVQKALEYEIERQIDGRWGAARRSCRRRGCGTPSAASPSRCAPRRRPTTIATSPIPICRRWRSPSELIERLRAELARAAGSRGACALCSEHGLSDQDAAELTRERALSDYFEADRHSRGRAQARGQLDPDRAAVQGCGPAGAVDAPVSPQGLAELLRLVQSGKISVKLAKQIWPKMWDTRQQRRADRHRGRSVPAKRRRRHRKATWSQLVEANPDKVAAVPRGQDQDVRLVRGPDHARHPGQGQSGDGQRATQKASGTQANEPSRRPERFNLTPGPRCSARCAGKTARWCCSISGCCPPRRSGPLRRCTEVAEAIREMVVRGAPAIGCAAAMGLAAARTALPRGSRGASAQAFARDLRAAARVAAHGREPVLGPRAAAAACSNATVGQGVQAVREAPEARRWRSGTRTSSSVAAWGSSAPS